MTDVDMPDLPPAASEILETLWRAGHDAFVVGGSLRDRFIGREPQDWDFTTDAMPERVQAVFPGAVYENRFGTVVIRRDGVEYAITTYRSDHEYADHRRPHRVEFGDSLEVDLARRDFTVNAMAWGRRRSSAATGTAGRLPLRSEFELVDPFGGRTDVRARVLRAVGEPASRFEEDALRMIRAVRLAAALDFAIEPATLAAIREKGPLAAYLSGERIAAELERLLRAPRPSVGLRLMEETGLLAVISPELAAQRGIAQNKIEGEDLWDHTLRSVDAPPADRETVRLAALLHDIGKPATASPDGHFPDHETVGAEQAAALLARLHFPRSRQEQVTHLIRQHMFTYEPAWSDAAVRRFIGRVGIRALDDLFELRAADNIGSGLPPNAGRLDELRQRVRQQLDARVALTLADLAVNGTDLLSELGIVPGPEVGRILDSLLEQVIADSSLNDRWTLLTLARSMLNGAQ
ncbi:MAG TPA: HD domain-containing protein [Candidatus Saccharimonadales bacterium]|nr:HD domain-containing protein [Candidatus Saccharimonadales bacterium]